jgi:nitrous-oxide reductase
VDESTHMGTRELVHEVLQLDPKEPPDLLYFMPCPKSPHGCDVDPTGEYIVGSGKLAATDPGVLFAKIQKAIANKDTKATSTASPC